MSDTTSDAAVEHHGAHDVPVGWRRWLFATNHKDIGTLYLVFAFTNLLLGGVMALMIRTELFQPGLQIMRPEFFNQLVTEHGLIDNAGTQHPADAIIFNGEGLHVAVVEGGVAHLRKIEIARDFGREVEVRDGVRDGDRVILNPPADLADGAKVRIRPEQPAPTS